MTGAYCVRPTFGGWEPGAEPVELGRAIVASPSYRIALAVVFVNGAGASFSAFSQGGRYEEVGGVGSVCAVTCRSDRNAVHRSLSTRFSEALHGRIVLSQLRLAQLMEFLLRSGADVPGYWDKAEYIAALKKDLAHCAARSAGGRLRDQLADALAALEAVVASAPAAGTTTRTQTA